MGPGREGAGFHTPYRRLLQLGGVASAERNIALLH